MTTPNSTPPEYDRINQPPRRSVVALALLITVALGGGSLAVLFYRAATVPPNDHKIVVRGNAEWEGLDISVSGGDLKEPRTTKFELLGKYIVPFYLGPGKYHLEIRNQGTLVFEKQIELNQTLVEDIDLARLGVTTRPTTEPAPTTEPISITLPSTVPA